MASGEATAAAAGMDSVDGVMLKAGEVVYKGRDHELSILEKGLVLVNCKTDESGARLPVFDLSWRDVICACKAAAKKSKSVPSAKTSPPQEDTFLVYYIVKDAKTKKCRCQSVQLTAKGGESETWVSQIEKMRKEGKPKKLFVIINPIGGTGTALKQFEKISRPLFDLAGIELIVKVTERAQHGREIAKSIDTSAVDGVIIVGGDGQYMEVLHTLVLAAQEEAGVDVNDPEAKLVSPTVTFGILPGGTGNGTTSWLNGGKDFETATLNIIRGETNGIGVFSVHEPGKLLQYCGCLFSYGLFATMRESIDSHRWMKTARLVYGTIAKMLRKKRVYDIDLEVLRAIPPEKKEKEEKTEAEAASSATEWTKLGVKHVTSMMAIVAHVDMETEGNNLQLNPFTDVFHMSLVNTQSGFDYGKMLREYLLMRKDTYRHDYVEMINKLRGVRFRLVEEEKKEEEGARSNTGGAGQQDYTRLLDVDGENITCSVPQLEIRLHPYLIQAYSVKEL